MLLSLSFQIACGLSEAALPLLYCFRKYKKEWKKYYLPMRENCLYRVQVRNKSLLLCPKTWYCSNLNTGWVILLIKAGNIDENGNTEIAVLQESTEKEKETARLLGFRAHLAMNSLVWLQAILFYLKQERNIQHYWS